MASSCPGGIPSNPDIAGIGVRISIYVQTLQFLFPAILAFALSDRWDVSLESHYIESLLNGQITMLATGFALIISAFVQAKTVELTAYHALIVLDFAWLISLTSTTCSATLYIFTPPDLGVKKLQKRLRRRRKEKKEAKKKKEERDVEKGPEDEGAHEGDHDEENHDEEKSNEENKTLTNSSKSSGKETFETIETVEEEREDKEEKHLKAKIEKMTFVPCLHMTFMAAFALWFFSNPGKIDKLEPGCALFTKQSFLVRDVPVSSLGLRVFWLIIYSFCAIPVINTAVAVALQAGSFFLIRYLVLAVGVAFRIPFLLFFTLVHPYEVISRTFGTRYLVFLDRLTKSKLFVMVGAILLNIFIIICTEATVDTNDVQSGEDQWTFGQSISLLLIVPGLFSTIRSVRETYAKYQREKEERRNSNLPDNEAWGGIGSGWRTSTEKGWFERLKDENDDRRLPHGTLDNCSCDIPCSCDCSVCLECLHCLCFALNPCNWFCCDWFRKDPYPIHHGYPTYTSYQPHRPTIVAQPEPSHESRSNEDNQEENRPESERVSFQPSPINPPSVTPVPSGRDLERSSSGRIVPSITDSKRRASVGVVPTISDPSTKELRNVPTILGAKDGSPPPTELKRMSNTHFDPTVLRMSVDSNSNGHFSRPKDTIIPNINTSVRGAGGDPDKQASQNDSKSSSLIHSRSSVPFSPRSEAPLPSVVSSNHRSSESGKSNYHRSRNHQDSANPRRSSSRASRKLAVTHETPVDVDHYTTSKRTVEGESNDRYIDSQSIPKPPDATVLKSSMTFHVGKDGMSSRDNRNGAGRHSSNSVDKGGTSLRSADMGIGRRESNEYNRNRRVDSAVNGNSNGRSDEGRIRETRSRPNGVHVNSGDGGWIRYSALQDLRFVGQFFVDKVEHIDRESGDRRR